ncbi:Acetylornithine deacetylase/Succinyl-diaminopimelate desuccinylase [Maribacter dokdonensis]|uniref:Acetylornithine deacetylase/Succinyl-diaminopimelate desuccinylase n=1 Tax=Maribacter dokdonensis TaxID=320912 RepID=A0ABY0U2C1_9FLAO|nr:M20/M25/M40 family metallo-hydrolase [Maribacter dokdonensis]SDR94917.1 Acetylornithine deacetylase/Succinyl-diaminopimelate desuccinylase [Maribacter dokdonensis]
MKKLLTLTFLLLFFTAHSQDSILIKSKVANAIGELREFVAIPNDALNADDIDSNLYWLRKKFTERGFNSTILETEGLPLFFAALPMDDNKPTILFYMHLDGQSVDATKWDQPDPYKVVLKSKTEDDWKTESFSELNDDINYDWRLFGRSTSDDKGPIIMFLNAIDALKKDAIDIPFNVKVILDSEEEKSSAPLPQAVRTYKDLLKADFLVINDGPVHVSGKPTIVYGCRGITTLSITTHGPIKPQHSGHYGNYAPNPGFQLAQLLATMKDTNGKVLIKGYYDGISLDDATLAILKSVPDNADVINSNLAISNPEKVGGFYQEALQYPSLNIRGLGSGWVGEKARTIVPATATAELDLRLVPESDGTKLKNLVKEHIKNQGFHIMNTEPTLEDRLKFDKIVTIKEGSVTDAFRTDLNNPFGNNIVKTMESKFGEKPVQIRIMGGTVPISPFINELKIPAFIVPMVNPDNNQHSPNENLKIGQIAYGIKLFYALLSPSKTE